MADPMNQADVERAEALASLYGDPAKVTDPESEAKRPLVAVPPLEEVPDEPDFSNVRAVAEAVTEVEDTQTASTPDNKTAPKPKRVRQPKPVEENPPAEGEAEVGERWRTFVAPASPRGQSRNTHRVNIEVSATVKDRLNALDSQLADEGVLHTVSRTALLAAAIDLIAADPEGWEARSAEWVPTGLNLQARVDEERGKTLNRVRRPPTGSRNTTAMLAYAVAHLLDC